MLIKVIMPSTSLVFNGSGCPPGSTSHLLNGMARQFSLHTPITHNNIAARTAITVMYNAYNVEAGPAIPTGLNRKNCRLAFAGKCVVPLMRLLATLTLSPSQSSSRFLIRNCHRRLREFSLVSDRPDSSPLIFAARLLQAGSKCQCFSSVEILLYEPFPFTVLRLWLLHSSPGSSSHCSFYAQRPSSRWARFGQFPGTLRSFTWTP